MLRASVIVLRSLGSSAPSFLLRSREEASRELSNASFIRQLASHRGRGIPSGGYLKRRKLRVAKVSPDTRPEWKNGSRSLEKDVTCSLMKERVNKQQVFATAFSQSYYIKRRITEWMRPSAKVAREQTRHVSDRRSIDRCCRLGRLMSARLIAQSQSRCLAAVVVVTFFRHDTSPLTFASRRAAACARAYVLAPSLETRSHPCALRVFLVDFSRIRTCEMRLVRFSLSLSPFPTAREVRTQRDADN